MITGLISESGFEVVDEEGAADLSVIVTCSVKKVTEQRMVNRIAELAKHGGGKVVVAGCLPKAEPSLIQKINPAMSLVGPNNIDQIVSVIESALQNERRIELSDNKLVKLGLPRTRRNELVGVIEIATGCLSSCTFCQVKLVKGVVFSYPEEDILSEVKLLLSKGVREIWLTSTDNAAYGRDSGTNLARLVERVSEIPGDFKVRIGMMNPLLADKILDRLISCFSHEKVFKFLHLPVQSGSDRILRMMQRGYLVRDFYRTVEQFRSSIPSLTLSTDIIVGFPSESENDFLESIALLKEIRPDVVNLSRYGMRSGTKAASMERQIAPEDSKHRSAEMTKVIRTISRENNSKWIGWKGEVLVDEKVKNALVGRNFAYKPCLMRDTERTRGIFGREVFVRVEDCTASTLECQVQ